MLDLNVEAESAVHVFAGDDSGDSNASSSGGHHTMFNFLSLNIAENCDVVNEDDDMSCNNDHEELMTRQFFPVSQGSAEAAKARHFWMSSASQPGTAAQQAAIKKSRRGPRSRSSQYRGVTFYRRTERWESHIWDCGKQVYLGGFDTARTAAQTYDRAAIKFRGVDADINFHVNDYKEEMKQMGNLTKKEFVQSLRRQSTGFARKNSKYKGVALDKCVWEARRGQFLGMKAYDLAALTCKGKESMTAPGKVKFAATNGGQSENLDLNLSVSTPSAALVNDSFRTMQFQPRALK